jgi:hypothetical protein
MQNTKQKLINMIMIDCGLRVSEVVNLKYSDFDFKNKSVKIRTLKKREKTEHRTIPLSSRLYNQLATYIADKKNINPNDWMFPSPDQKNKHITRFAINKYLLRLSQKTNIKNLHPHAMRHSFATQLLTAGTPIENIKTLLGHTSIDTTLIYAHIPQQILRQNIENLQTKPSLMKKILQSLLKKEPQAIINLSFNTGEIVVGRSAELQQLTNNLNRNINTLIQGNIGVGKSWLLNQLHGPAILKLDDISNIKKSLANILIYLYNNDKEALFNILYSKYDKSKAIEIISRESVRNLCNEIIKITEKNEYILLIDTLDNISNKGVQTLEFLKDHFTIIGSAREIKIDKSSFLWNFDTIRLKNMSRSEAIDLIQRLSYNLQIPDYDLFKNHVYEQSAGNPRAIYELCDRYQKEPILTAKTIRAIHHHGARKEIDCTVIILIFLATIACLRYLNHEVENNSFRFIGGCALVLMIISRYFIKSTKQKTF